MVNLIFFSLVFGSRASNHNSCVFVCNSWRINFPGNIVLQTIDHTTGHWPLWGPEYEEPLAMAVLAIGS